MKSYHPTFLPSPEHDQAKDYTKAEPVETGKHGFTKPSPGNKLPAEILRKHFNQPDLSMMYVLPEKEMKSQRTYGLYNPEVQFAEVSSNHRSLYKSDKTDQMHHLFAGK